MANYRAFALANTAMYRLMFDQPIPGFSPSDTVRSAALIHTVLRGIATKDAADACPQTSTQTPTSNRMPHR